MNISLICERKEYNFSLPLEVSLKYIKNLSSRIFRCEFLDIYYKGDKITNDENEEEILLRDIIPNEESNIKLKIILNSTERSSKNQTPSIDNLNNYKISKTLDLDGNELIEISKKKFNQKNKVFEAIYTQKVKKLFSSIKEFNEKIIEIDNFLFKKNSNLNKNNLIIFEKKLYEFIDSIKLYFAKLIAVLEINNYVTYNEMIRNLSKFYNELIFNDEFEQELLNCQTNCEVQTITSTPINKFPINLKKSENSVNFNLDRFNFFNKSSKKPSIKNALLLSNKNTEKNRFQIKASILKNIKNISRNEQIDKKSDEKNKENLEIINTSQKNKIYINKDIGNLIENIEENEKLESNDENEKIEKNEDNNENNNEDSEEKKGSTDNKNSEKKNETDIESSKKTQTNLSEKSINNISSITKKTTKSLESNKNDSSEDEIKEIKNSLNKSNNNENKEKIVPFNLDLANKKDSKKENEEIKNQNKAKQQLINSQKKPNLKKFNASSIIQENENENMTSSLDDSNNTNINNIKTINKSVNIKGNNEGFNSGKKMNKKEVQKNGNNSNKNINKFAKDLSSTDQKTNFVNGPIYHISSSSDAEMAKALSRRLSMKKKKNKTANKYDFII